MHLLKPIVVFAFSSLMCLSLVGQNYQGDQEDLDIILENIAQFSQDYINGRADKIAAAYTLDAKIFPSGSDIIEGRAAIQKYWTRGDDTNVFHHKVTPIELKIIGDEAYDYGYYEGRSQWKDNEPSSWKGKYVIIWKKINGEWKIYLDIWNNIQEPREN